MRRSPLSLTFECFILEAYATAASPLVFLEFVSGGGLVVALRDCTEVGNTWGGFIENKHKASWDLLGHVLGCPGRKRL